MKPIRAALGSALVAAAAAVVMLPSGADAGTLAQAGWWWRVNDGLPTAPPAPPNVPEGGLMVAGAPDGATALAALHFDLSDGEGSPLLTLQVAENGDQGGEAALLAACLTGSAWQPASAGPWSSKPFPACSEGSVNGVRAEDGSSWTFALTPLLSDGVLDVTLVPLKDPTLPPGADGSTFQLVFEPPTAAALTTTTGGGGDFSSDFSVPDFTTSDFAAPTGDFAAPAGGDLSLPPVDSSGLSASLPQGEQGLTATAPVAQQQNAPLAASPVAAVEEHKGLAALVLALCGAALLWSAQLPVPAPRRLGAFGAADAAVAEPPPPQTSGLGRFARTRSGAPPPL
jgi:hypothetical protein